MAAFEFFRVYQVRKVVEYQIFKCGRKLHVCCVVQKRDSERHLVFKGNPLDSGKPDNKMSKLWNVCANTLQYKTEHPALQRKFDYMTRCEHFYGIIKKTKLYCYKDAEGIPHVLPGKTEQVQNCIRSYIHNKSFDRMFRASSLQC